MMMTVNKIEVLKGRLEDMKKVVLDDIRKQPYENWNYYKYESYNNCPSCGGKIYMRGQVNEYQRFICKDCGADFILNAITEEIEMR